jgi:hypothetical protein
MTAGIKKAGHEARLFCHRQSGPGGARLRPSLPNYFFLYVFFLAFLAFFAAFFAFLAIASSFGLMDGNATPRPARGGLASQQPQLISEQIRWLVSRGVTALSRRYPQLCCVFRHFSPRNDHAAQKSRSSCPGLTRASINLRKSLAREMDRRIKSGDDAVWTPPVTVNKPPTDPRRLSIQNHIEDCAHRGDQPLSAAAASSRTRTMGIVMGRLIANRGDVRC